MINSRVKNWNPHFQSAPNSNLLESNINLRNLLSDTQVKASKIRFHFIRTILVEREFIDVMWNDKHYEALKNLQNYLLLIAIKY